MSEPSECVLSIAGFDPSGGAGVLSDGKTFESCSVRGLAVCTALTYQTDSKFFGLHWCTQEEISAQLDPLLERFSPKVAKIGIIENLAVLEAVLHKLEHAGVNFVLWDPVFKASAGFAFHDSFEQQQLERVLSLVSLVTPNCGEYEALGGGNLLTPCLVTGREEGGEVKDTLFQGGKEVRSWSHKKLDSCEKHGSGCVLSSALVSRVARGDSLEGACSFAIEYISTYLQSSSDLLGWHTSLRKIGEA